VTVDVVVVEPGDGVQVAGLVAPAGPMTEQATATLAENPFDGTTVITEVFPVVAPAARLSVVGAAVRVKLGVAGAVTVTVTVAVSVIVPDLPVAVTV